MSSSATAPTSTTASSTNSASNPPANGIVDSSAHPGVQNYPPSLGHPLGARPEEAANPKPEKIVDIWSHSDVPKCPSSSGERAETPGKPIEVVACGALAGHIREIAARRGWPVQVRPIAAALHNRPQQIKSHAERMLASPETQESRAVLAYADCGTYGALDKLAAQAGVSRLPGLHCYDLYAGAKAIEQLFKEEPGTYLLTDYLIRSFDRSVIQPLGLDRHPELWPDYFAHYRRLVWLVQQPTAELEEAASRIAACFDLPLTRVETGTQGLEEALEPLIDLRDDLGADAPPRQRTSDLSIKKTHERPRKP